MKADNYRVGFNRSTLAIGPEEVDTLKKEGIAGVLTRTLLQNHPEPEKVMIN